MKKIIVMIIVLSGQLAFGMQAPLNLIDAAGVGQLDRVRELLDAGANVDALNENQTTPLMRAAGNGQVDVVRLLLDRGANINAQNLGAYGEGRTTALSRAVENGHYAVVLELLTFIPLAERKAIWETIFGLLSAFRPSNKPPFYKDIRDLITHETFKALLDREMQLVLERASVLVNKARYVFHLPQYNWGSLSQFVRDYLPQSHPTLLPQYQRIADLLDLENPASQQILRDRVEANIRRIVANSIPKPVVQQQQQQPPNGEPQPWYQRAWNSVKQTTQSYWKWIVGGTAVTVGGYMAWKKMQKK